jgi:hypothetical protein
MRCRAISATARWPSSARADLFAVEACTFDRPIRARRIVLTQICAAVCEHPGRPALRDGIAAKLGPPSGHMFGAGLSHTQWRRPGSTVVQTVSECGSRVLPGQSFESP